MDPAIINLVKVFFPFTLSFGIGLMIAPPLGRFLHRHKLWKKHAGKIGLDGKTTEVFNKLHRHKEIGTPKMGGVVIWASAFITIILFRILAEIFPSDLLQKMEFLSRNQTWLPLFTLVIGSLIGLFDDSLEIQGNGGHFSGGLSLTKRLFMVALIGLVGGLWFFLKLDVAGIDVPFLGEVAMGALIVPFFIAVALGIYSGGVIDGVDGLAGGVFAATFASYGGIAFFQNQIDLAAFCAVIVGGILAFLWFNIPPARFYMSETGTMGLTITLAVVAFLTKAVAVLPIIALPLAATTFSDILQIASKKFRHGKKIFHVAPLHHHFEAIGWPSYKVAMRYWVVSTLCAVAGMILALAG